MTTHAPFWKRAGNEDLSGFRLSEAEQAMGYRGGGDRATYRSIEAWRSIVRPGQKNPTTWTACGKLKRVNGNIVDSGWTCEACVLATTTTTTQPYSAYDAAFFDGKPRKGER